MYFVFVLVNALVFVLVDELDFLLIYVLVLVLVKVLSYVLVEVLVCVPVEQHFQYVNHLKPAFKLSEKSCVNLWKAAVQCCDRHDRSVNMPRGHLNSANFRLQKRSSQFFNKRFSPQTFKKLSIVNLPFLCAIMTSRLRYRGLTLDLS